MIKLNLQNLLDNTKRRTFFWPNSISHVLIVHALVSFNSIRPITFCFFRCWINYLNLDKKLMIILAWNAFDSLISFYPTQGFVILCFGSFVIKCWEITSVLNMLVVGTKSSTHFIYTFFRLFYTEVRKLTSWLQISWGQATTEILSVTHLSGKWCKYL